MVFRRLDPFGNPNVGVYARATSNHLFLPPGLTKQNIADFEAALGLEAIVLTVASDHLIGSLMAANRHGIVVADLARDDEVEVIGEASGLPVHRLTDSRLNAAGNNLLVNNKGGVHHPDLPADQVAAMSDTLGVELLPASIDGRGTVGTAAVATDAGVLVHPRATEAELSFLAEALHARATIGTVNHGHGMVGAGMAANQHGAVCGSRTTGIELGRIEETLHQPPTQHEETP